MASPVPAMAAPGGGSAAAAAVVAAASGKRAASPRSPVDAGKRPRQDASEAGVEAGSAPLASAPDTPMHLMRVRGIPTWANEGFLGVTLNGLVCGAMKWCLVSNFMMDFRWLLSACPDLQHAERLLLVHGEQAGTPTALKLEHDVAQAGLKPKTSLFAPSLPIQYGTHHSKAFMIEYERGLRVIIFSANAVYPDCNNKTQGLFWQDFPKKDDASPQTSSFQEELHQYLQALSLPLPQARRALALVAAHDFSAARAHLVASVPGYHKGAELHKWGHMRLRAILNREPPFPAAFKGAPLLAQFTSLGSFTEDWLLHEFGASMAAGHCVQGGRREPLGLPRAAGPAGLQLVWTTVSEVQNSIEGWFAGRSIPGPEKNVGKPFLQRYWHRWGGEVCGRQRTAPHIKSFLRYSSSGDVAWLYVGSHNLSMAAWGQLQKQASQLMCRSYELGVLLVPSLEAAYRASRWCGFSATSDAPLLAAAAASATAAGSDAAASAGPSAPAGASPRTVRFVPWQRGASQEAAAEDGALRVPLPIPYPLPPQRYEPGDSPWMVDRLNYPGLDMLGRKCASATGSLYGWLESDEGARGRPHWSGSGLA